MIIKDDIPFAKGPSTRLTPVIMGFMVYLACLSLAGALSLNSFVRAWEEGLSSRLTLQIPPPQFDGGYDDDTYEKLLRDTLAAVRKVPGVEKAEILPAEQMASLLEPWVGDILDLEDLPLPRLISVDLVEGENIDLDELIRQVHLVSIHVKVDNHGLWQEQLTHLMGGFQLVAVSFIILVAIVVVTMVIFAIRGAFLAHRNTIELLHMLGARDGYIAGQFQYHAFIFSLLGSSAGFFMAVLTILLLGQAAESVGTALPQSLLFHPLNWLWLFAVTVLSIVISVTAARITIMRILRQYL